MAVKRVNDSVLGALERPALAWMADRLPSSILPNHLTMLGICGAWLAAAGFVLSRWSLSWLWLGCLGLLANWCGDSLDGTLARRRHIERPRFGFFLDHTCDLFSQILVFLALGISPLIHFAVACLGLIAFLTAFVHTLIGIHVRNTMRITYWGFGATEIRALLFFGNLLTLTFGIVYILPPPAYARFGPISLYDIVISILSVFAVSLIAALSIREIRALAVEDPPPTAPPGSTPRADLHTSG